MHLIRAHVTPLVPIARKGTQYVARPRSHHRTGVSVLVAVRDMLKLAHTTREVQAMIKSKSLMINGRAVRDFHEAIHLYTLLDADKRYKVGLTTSGRLTLEATTAKTRVAKIVGKKMLRGKVVQVNFHDGTNVLTKENVVVGGSAEIDLHNKVVRWIPLEKGAHVFVRSGSSKGHAGTVKSLEDGKVHVTIGGRTVALDSEHVIAQ